MSQLPSWIQTVLMWAGAFFLFCMIVGAPVAWYSDWKNEHWFDLKRGKKRVGTFKGKPFYIRTLNKGGNWHAIIQDGNKGKKIIPVEETFPGLLDSFRCKSTIRKTLQEHLRGIYNDVALDKIDKAVWEMGYGPAPANTARDSLVQTP